MTSIKKFAAFVCAALAFAGTAAAAQTAPAAAPAAPPAPPTAAAPENVWHLDLSTGGRVSIALRPDVAPAHVERIRTLTRQGFYNGVLFHRVVPGFMAQSGDPTGTGQGGSPLPDLAPEFNHLPHLRGSVAMARAQAENSANSQFYIMLSPTLTLDGRYTVFGRVFAGMNFVDAIAEGEPPANPSRIVRASIGSDNVAALPAEQLLAAGAPAQPAAPAPAPVAVTPAPSSVLPPPR